MAERYFPANLIRICLDKEDEVNVEGRVYSKLSPEPVFFKSCEEFILETDRIFDRAGYPQAFQDKRRFRGQEACAPYSAHPRLYLTDEEIGRQRGAVWTRDVIVAARRGNSWQGILLGEDVRREMTFDGEMKLMEYLFFRRR